LLIYCQSWTYKQGEDAFDGKYKTSSIIGKGYEFPYTKPLFVINVYRGETDNPNIYITEVPSATCDNNKVLIKFDNDDYIFRPRVYSSSDDRVWFLDFDVLDFSTNSTIRKDTVMESFEIIEYKIEPSAKLVIRKESNPNSKTLITLNKAETIDIFNYDKNNSYWQGQYIDSVGRKYIGFINDVDVGDLKTNGKKTSRTITIPIIKEYVDSDLKDAGTSIELVKFLTELKTHKTMHLRLLSDCVKSDFEFSLSGSTSAINFVLKK